jgi:hypothetical protein
VSQGRRLTAGKRVREETMRISMSGSLPCEIDKPSDAY